jgi:hypothetical protein
VTSTIIWALLLTVPLWLPALGGYKRVTGRVVVLGLVAGEAAITNWGLVYQHRVHAVGLALVSDGLTRERSLPGVLLCQELGYII